MTVSFPPEVTSCPSVLEINLARLNQLVDPPTKLLLLRQVVLADFGLRGHSTITAPASARQLPGGSGLVMISVAS